MTFGLSDDGFTIKRETEIITDLENGFKAEFGEINTDPASVFGQVIGVISKPLAELWELMELVYLSEYPSSAEGISLDGVAHLTGVTRLGTGKTTVTGLLIGDQGTIANIGFSASVEETEEIFFTTEDVTIDKADVLRCGVEVLTILDSTLYTITIDGEDYEYTSSGSATASEIITGLESAINVGQSKVTAVDDEDDTMTITVDDKATSFSILVDSNLGLDEIATPAEFEAQNSGPILAVSGSLTKIETPVSGVDAVDNLTDGNIGRDVETDTELRIRRELSLRILGAATVEAITARLLQEVENVTAVKVLENDSETYNDTIIVTVSQVENNTDYSVFINGLEFTITSDADATAPEIALALVNVINLSGLALTATDNTDGTFDVDPDSEGIIFSFTVGERLTQSGTIPPHSFEAIVSGGTDEDIANKLWELKAAGIGTWGNVIEIVEDSEGDDHEIRFSRPVNKYAWIKIEYFLNPEEDFPINGEDQIKANVLELGNTFDIGDDYIIQKFYTPVYAVSGISSVNIYTAITDTPGGTPAYDVINISIGQGEIAVFADARVWILEG